MAIGRKLEVKIYTIPRTNIAPENGPSQKEGSLPIIIHLLCRFSGRLNNMFTLNNWYNVSYRNKSACNCNIGSITAGMFAYNLPFKNNSQRYIYINIR